MPQVRQTRATDFFRLLWFWHRLGRADYYKSDTFKLNIFTAFTVCFRPKKDLYFIIQDNGIVGEGHLRGWSEGYSVPFFGMYARRNGSLMLEFLIEKARERGASLIGCHVHESNSRAINLYKRHGLEIVEDLGDRYKMLRSI